MNCQRGVVSRFSGLLFAHCAVFFFVSCSIPNLETADCKDSRDAVKQMYSVHFGGDMKPTADNLKSGEKFLTEELISELRTPTDDKTDYFTQTDDYPKAFRIGSCSVSQPGERVLIQILLFWKDDNRSEEKEIFVESVKRDGKWLISKVSAKD